MFADHQQPVAPKLVEDGSTLNHQLPLGIKISFPPSSFLIPTFFVKTFDRMK
jgi:hypothetical protein